TKAQASCEVDEALSYIEVSVSYLKDDCIAIAEWFTNLLRLVEAHNGDGHDGRVALRRSNGVRTCRWTSRGCSRDLGVVAWFVDVVSVVYASLRLSEAKKFFGLYQKRHSLLPLRCRVFIVAI